MSAAGKKALRAAVRGRIAALPPGYTRDASAAVCTCLRALEAYKSAGTVFCFVGTPGEIDTRTFLAGVLADGKRLCVPVCEKGGAMTARCVCSLAELAPGLWGIPEPPAAAQEIMPQDIDLCVAPCLAADLQKRRLGQGGGYYDRFLPRLRPGAVSALVCREKLLLPAVPVEPHDAVCTLLVTEARVVT